MNFKKLLRHLTSVCFLLFIGVIFLFSCLQFLRLCQAKLNGEENTSLKGFFFDYRIPKENAFISINGGWQRLLGAREVNERFRLDNGHLTYIIPEEDTDGIAANTVDFYNAVSELNIPFLYVNTPFKIDADDKQLPPSISDYSNENADKFLAKLYNNSVPVLDLRSAEKDEKLNHYDLFYMTDHHWKAETGFWAYNEIVDYLAKLDNSWGLDPMLKDISNYGSLTYSDISLGSAGRRVGPLYAGKDDISLIYPEFETALSFTVPDENIQKNGTYSETILFPERLTESDDFTVSRYTVYCGGDYSLLLTKNNSSADDLPVRSAPKRLIVIKDSFSEVVIPFLSLGYDEVDYIDLRLFRDDLISYIESREPDLVMVIYNPGAYESNNREMFDFIKH